jgi:hypothetical protein
MSCDVHTHIHTHAHTHTQRIMPCFITYKNILFASLTGLYTCLNLNVAFESESESESEIESESKSESALVRASQ